MTPQRRRIIFSGGARPKKPYIVIYFGEQSNGGTDPNTGRVEYTYMPSHLKAAYSNVFFYNIAQTSTGFTPYQANSANQMGYLDQIIYILSQVYEKVYIVKRAVGGTNLYLSGTAAFTASISGTTLTVSAISSGAVEGGMSLVGSTLSPAPTILTQLTGSTGSTGTYLLNGLGGIVSSRSMTAGGAQYPRTDFVDKSNNAVLNANFPIAGTFDELNLWGQCESDAAGTTWANAYDTTLAAWIASYRSTVKNRNWIIKKISNKTKDFTYRSTVATKQQAVVDADSTLTIIPTDNIRQLGSVATVGEYGCGDFSHLRWSSTFVVGNRFLEKILQKYGRTKPNNTKPTLVSAATDVTGNILTLTFDKTLNAFVDPYYNCFTSGTKTWGKQLIQITGTISGTTLTVTDVSGSIYPLRIGTRLNTGVSTILNETIITGQLTGTAGGAGTYSISVSQTVTTPTATTLTASITGTTLNVTVQSGTAIKLGTKITGVGVTDCYVTGFTTGTGGTGTYIVSVSQTVVAGAMTGTTPNITGITQNIAIEGATVQLYPTVPFYSGQSYTLAYAKNALYEEYLQDLFGNEVDAFTANIVNNATTVEPAITNIYTSNFATASDGGWGGLGGGVVAWNDTAPDGSTGCDKMTIASGFGQFYKFNSGFTLVNGRTYRMTVNMYVPENFGFPQNPSSYYIVFASTFPNLQLAEFGSLVIRDNMTTLECQFVFNNTSNTNIQFQCSGIVNDYLWFKNMTIKQIG